MKTSILVMAIVGVTALVNIASADTFGTGDNQFTIDFVNISGDASSANGTAIGTGGKTFSDPSNDYRMGIYEITNDQWDKFQASYGAVTGSSSNAYDEEPYWDDPDVPTNMLSWYEGAQFVNYLNTSTGHQAAYKFTGTQGTGDYTFALWQPEDLGYDSDNPYRNSEAYYFMPTEDEWVKAAYWNGTSLQTYAYQVGESLTQGDGTSGTGWNYFDRGHATDPSGPWDVGSGSEELNGTFDMMGNVWEIMENPWASGDYQSGSLRVIRGGSFDNPYYRLRFSSRVNVTESNENNLIGFRVASVPEPAIIQVSVDVKPGSCPNPLRVNFRGNGVLPVAILGSDDFNVYDIDITTITLEGVSPIRSSFGDVSTPFEGEDCECSTLGPDGDLDLVLKFDREAVLNALEDTHGDLAELPNRAELALTLVAMTYEGTPLEGKDCLRVLNRGAVKRKK